MVWSVQQRVFAVRRYFENGESIIQTQRDFRTNFDIPRHGTIPDRNTILRWVTAFNTTGTVLMKRTNGRNRAIRTPENVDRVRLDTLRSPNRSVRLRAVALGINESSVNSERYIEMLTQFFFPELQRRRVSIRKVWFQQDGATSHTARASMEVLRQKFPGRLISRFGDVPWPPRSPNLSLCDFFCGVT